MKDMVAMIPNWLSARRTLGAVESIKKFYPDLLIYIVDDYSDEADKPRWMQDYRGIGYLPDVTYDSDTDKLKYIPGTCFIQVPTHRRHGESIDYALPFINAKWVLHLDSDARFIQSGIIEYMMQGMNDEYCGCGISKVQSRDYRNKMANYLMIFRVDLAKEHNLKFEPIYELGLETGTRYWDFLVKQGYKVKFLNGLDKYYVHLRYKDEDKQKWDKYY